MNVGFGPNTALAAVTLAAINATLLASEAFRAARRATERESLSTAPIADRRVRSFQRLLVVAQLAVSFALAANAALLVHSWQSVRRIDPGLRLGGLWLSWLNVPVARYDTAEKIARLAVDLEQSLQTAPGVRSAAVSTTTPLTSSVTFAFQRASVPVERAADLPRCVYYGVGQNYFATAGTRLIAGRLFNADDRAGGTRVAIISESLARQYFPQGNALDQWIVPAFGPREWRRIVGIVADVKQGNILQSAPPQFYEPFAQSPVGGFVLFVRLDSAAPFSEASFRAAVGAVDATLAPRAPLPLDQYMAAQTAPARLAAQSLVTAAALAVLLALAGFGALLALTTAQRAREFGVRLTLGATPRQIVTLVVREGLMLAALGGAAGALGAWALGQAAQATLYGTPPPAMETFGIAAVALLACVAIACALPAWRAARTDPALCLRSE
jgi:putative ABC transport system permease protein